MHLATGGDDDAGFVFVRGIRNEFRAIDPDIVHRRYRRPVPLLLPLLLPLVDYLRHEK